MIHSREVSALMNNIYFMWYLIENYNTNDAVKELVDNNRRKLFFKEIAISVLIGILFAFITGFAAWIWFSDLSLSIIVGAAMVINILSAGLFGFLIPYIFNKVKIDPALASSVFVTTITDVFGFLSFLGLASIYLF